jgi:hypothetical protein
MLQRADTETLAREVLPAKDECILINGAMQPLALIPASRSKDVSDSDEPPSTICGRR